MNLQELEALTHPHPSRPWNPLIAQAFYRRGIIESWGRGTIKIAELIEAAGLTAPVFECGGGEVLVRFRPAGYALPAGWKASLSPLQEGLLEALAVKGPASLGTLRETLKIAAAERTIQENLAALRDLGMVESAGRGRGARWTLKGTQP